MGITPGSRDRCGPPNEEELLRAMRREDASAFRHYTDHYHRILVHYARRLHLTGADAEELVFEVLDDVALTLIAPGAPTPSSLQGYLVQSLRRKLFVRMRSTVRYARAVREAAQEGSIEEPTDTASGIGAEPAGAAACSQYLLRVSRGAYHDQASLSPALAHMWSLLEAELTEAERELLTALGENVPQREIALRLGVAYAAMRKRIERLRARLAVVATRHLDASDEFDEDERAELERFLRRSGAGAGLLRIGTRTMTVGDRRP